MRGPDGNVPQVQHFTIAIYAMEEEAPKKGVDGLKPS
jgi:hypothetical protein